MIKELFANEAICRKCKIRKVRLQDAQEDGAKIQSCKCSGSRYYCWVADNIWDKEDDPDEKGE